MGNFVQLFPNKIQETVLERRRGDTFSIEFECYDEDGSPLDTSTGTFLLTVNALRFPKSINPPEFVLYGSGSGNVVTFPMTPAEADRVGAFFYDMQRDDSGDVRTFVGGPFVMAEDVTKGNPGQIWTPDSAIIPPQDGAEVPFSGEDFWWINSDTITSGTTILYETREGEKVIRITGGTSNGGPRLCPYGPSSYLQSFPGSGIHEITVETYLPAPVLSLAIESYDLDSYSLRSEIASIESGQYVWITGANRDGVGFLIDAFASKTYPTTPGWVTWKWLIDQTNLRSAFKQWAGRIADEESTPWGIDVNSPADDIGTIPIPTLGFGSMSLYPYLGPASVMDIRTWKWEKVG